MDLILMTFVMLRNLFYSRVCCDTVKWSFFGIVCHMTLQSQMWPLCQDHATAQHCSRDFCQGVLWGGLGLQFGSKNITHIVSQACVCVCVCVCVV